MIGKFRAPMPRLIRLVHFAHRNRVQSQGCLVRDFCPGIFGQGCFVRDADVQGCRRRRRTTDAYLEPNVEAEPSEHRRSDAGRRPLDHGEDHAGIGQDGSDIGKEP